MRRHPFQIWGALPAVVVAGSMFLPGAAAAQTGLLRPKVVIAAGATSPAGPKEFSDLWNLGFALSGGLQLFSTPSITLDVETGYYQHFFDTDAFEASIRDVFPNVNVSGNGAFVIPVLAVANVALLPYGTTRPYVTAGAGFYHVGSNTPSRSGPGAEGVDVPRLEGDAFGARFGLGVRTALMPGASLFIDITYHIAWIDPDPIRFVPLRLGVRF